MRRLYILMFVSLLTSSAAADVRLPKLVSDGMVLQREAPITLWGWADNHEQISIEFLGTSYTTSADDSGQWRLQLPPLQPGGPHEMKITASNRITIHDILIGDVWVCSGQSNMELPMRRVAWKYPEEIARSENKFIRQFSVPQSYDFKTAQADLQSGHWKSANPVNVLDFSAVAYFFANDLYKTCQIPVGLINASLGGSPAEAWMSAEALKQFPHHESEAKRFRDDALIAQIEREDRERSEAWYRLLRQKDEGYKNPRQSWADPNFACDDWSTLPVPGYWSGTEPGPVNGVVWFRREVDIPADLAGRPGKLILGRIVDADSAFINGVFVGTVSYQYPPRRYEVPAGLLKAGPNTLVVRVISNIGEGGFVPDKPYQIIVDRDTIDLKGTWRFRLGAKMDPLAGQTFIRWKPMGLYNAMISPLLNYRIKGVIWYQGESNAGRPQEYRTLFPALIRDWRSHWNQGDFPFLFVQLPNFMEARPQPSQSGWALFREAQQSGLSLANTAMVVAIDLGEWNDVHPLAKKPVGERLALAARKIACGEKHVIHSGPVYKSMRVEKNKIILSFDHCGSGLMAKGSKQLHAFAIATADQKFVWAKAKINKNTVVVWNDKIKTPVAVRYAWADNPQGANLYNKEGLPASPFRTDNF